MARTLGNLLLHWRTQKVWLQSDVARTSGVSRSYVSKLETDTERDPSLFRVHKVVVALGHTLDETMAELGLARTRPAPRAVEILILDLLQELSPDARERVREYAQLLRDAETARAAARPYVPSAEDVLARDLMRARGIPETAEEEETAREEEEQGQ